MRRVQDSVHPVSSRYSRRRATDATANLDAPSRRGSVNYMVDHICEPMPSTVRIFRTMPLAARCAAEHTAVIARIGAVS